MKTRLLYPYLVVGILIVLLLLVITNSNNKIKIKKNENKNRQYMQEKSKEAVSKNVIRQEEIKKVHIKQASAKDETVTNRAINKVVINQQDFQSDDEMYVKSIQNLYAGNCITYDKGYYYYRSQKDYSLCKMDKNEKDVKKLADDIPGSIYVKDNIIYFTNISDNCTLYIVHTDGTNLKKISDIPMKKLIVTDEKVYFRSEYNKKYDIHHIYMKNSEKDDLYVYCMNLDGTGITLLFGGKQYDEFSTNGR